MKEKVFSIDPGNFESGYALWDGEKIIEFGLIENEALLIKLRTYISNETEPSNTHFAIEKIASYGMATGQEVYDTCEWIGNFERLIKEYFLVFITTPPNVQKIFRRAVKLHLCGSTQAKDGNIVQALVDRFGNTREHGKYAKGTKKNPGFFYGMSADCWQAFALAVYYFDNFLAKK